MSEAKKTTLADIKPGHSIFDEAWARSEPQSKRYASHLTQLYEAKIEIEQLQADRDALLAALKDVMKEGEHDGPCTNEYDDSVPCLKHILASETRDKNALDLISKIENRKQAESH